MTKDKIKKHNRKIGQMNRRNNEKLRRIGVMVSDEIEVFDNDKCEVCGALLPTAQKEIREGGWFEFVIECRYCGAVYTD